MLEDQRNQGQTGANAAETTIFCRDSSPLSGCPGGLPVVGNSEDFVGQVLEEDVNSNIVRKTAYTYNTTTGDMLSNSVTPAPGQPMGSSTSATWSYTYEPSGSGADRLLSASEPLSYRPTTWSFTDSSSSHTITQTDPLLRSTITTLNAQGQPIKVQDPIGNIATTTYNSYGDVATVVDPANQSTGLATTYGTDADGRVTSVTSPLNETTTIAYNAIDEVTAVTDPLGQTTTYTYDLLGAAASETTPKGYTTTITRPPSLASQTVTDPAGNTEVTNLDGRGRRTSFVDKRGIKDTYTWDLYGRLMSAVFDSNNVSGYTKRIVSESNFDALDRVGTITDVLGTTTTDTINRTYDGVGNILSESITGNTAASTSYEYDSNGRRTRLSSSVSNNSAPTVNYGYDCADELIGISINGAVTSCSPTNYVSNGSLTAQIGTIGWMLDGDGNTYESIVDGILTVFGRDADERITSQAYSASPSNYSYGNLTHGYDADGRMIDKGGTLATTGVPASDTATYNNVDQVSTFNGSTVAPDAAENITESPGLLNSYTWDARNQLYQIQQLGLLQPTSVTYDALGRRNSIGGLSFVDDGSQMVASFNSTSNTFSSFLDAGVTLAGTVGGTTWVPLLDVDGSTIALINPSSPNNPPSTTYSYDAFGGTTVSGTSTGFPFMFHSLESGEEPSGTYYLQDGEYYAPGLQRELQQVGPAGLSGPGSDLTGGRHHRTRNLHGNPSHIAALDGGGDGCPDCAAYFNQEPSSDSGNVNIPIVGLVIQAWESFIGWIEGFFDNSKPSIPRQLLHAIHPLYLKIIAVIRALLPGEESVALTIPMQSFAPGAIMNVGGPATVEKPSPAQVEKEKGPTITFRGCAAGVTAFLGPFCGAGLIACGRAIPSEGATVEPCLEGLSYCGPLAAALLGCANPWAPVPKSPPPDLGPDYTGQ